MTTRDVADPCVLPVIPGYHLLRTLGRGGMGTVFLARQETLGRDVCVKTLAIPEGADAESCRERFRREAKLLATVSHPHILTILDFGTTADANVPFLVTEYIEGGDLRRLLRNRPLPTNRVRAIVAQIGEALLHLQGKGILHRDLKPENILLPTESLVKVADFGLAVARDQKGLLTATHCGLGTLGYASPEQQNALEVDERSDQYSLAALAYELLTQKRALGSFKPPSEINPRLGRKVDAALARALANDPANRYARLQDFLKDLDDALASSARPRWLVPTAVGLPILALAGGWTFWGRPAGNPPPPAPVVVQSAPAVVQSAPAVVQSAPAVAPEKSPEFEELTRLRAFAIWKSQGSPEGEAGATVAGPNWFQAETEIAAEVDERAFHIWESQGKPTGAEGEAVREPNRRRAEVELLREFGGGAPPC